MLKNKKTLEIIGIGSLCLFLLGCSRESFLISSKDSSSTIVLEEEVVLTKESFEEALEEEEEGSKEENMPETEEIAVHICGAVENPGVYFFQKNQRIYEGIIKAGGFRADADTEYLNQALFLEDGMKIVVPTKEETRLLKEAGKTAAEESFLWENFISAPNKKTEEKINLNTADKARLCTLPGIGDSRAESIIAYRQEHGEFQNIEEIMNVSGIKEAAYEKIKEYITVSP